MYVTLIVNIGVLFLISSDILKMLGAASWASTLIGATFIVYLALVAMIHQKMRGTDFLIA